MILHKMQRFITRNIKIWERNGSQNPYHALPFVISDRNDDCTPQLLILHNRQTVQKDNIILLRL